MAATDQSGINQARDFLSVLFAKVPEDIYFTLNIKDKGADVLRSAWYQVNAAGIAQAAADGVARAAAADVYFSTCPAQRAGSSSSKRISQKDVACVPALFVDVDTQEDPAKAGKLVPVDRQAAAAALEGMELPPSIMVDSGHGIHSYWLLDDPLPPAEGKRLLKALLERVKALTGWKDLDNASEPARILRLPGTFNHKGADPLPVTMLEASGAVYSLDEIRTFLKEQLPADGPADDQSARAGQVAPSMLADDELIAKATSAKNGQRFADLWNGSAAGYKSQSEADAALCCHLAFWTGKDPERMDRLFRISGLMRDKWDEKRGAEGETYGELTIRDAIEKTTNVYSPGGSHDAQASNPALAPFYAAYEKVPGFGMKNGEIVSEKYTKDGVIEIPLATGTALIREEITRDDGADSWKEFRIEGADQWGRALPSVSVKTAEYDRLDWTKKAWGTAYNIYPGASQKDKLRFAIIEASKRADPPMQYRAVYAHTGWRTVGGRRVFLFNGGAVGMAGVDVELDGNLASYQLPSVASSPAEAIAASLELLQAAPYRVSMPVFAHTFLAPLCDALHKGRIPPAFVLFLSGGTGTRKTTLAALELAHFGPEWSASRMPASFADTASSIRNKAFICKDVPLLVDDFHPASNPKQKAGMVQIAHDLATAWGDYAERGRLRADLTLATAKPPRGLGLITGEDAPNVTESGSARYYVVEVKKSDIPVSEALQRVQASASSGLLAGAMRAYIEYLATIPEAELIRMLADAFTKYRTEAQAALQGAHGRLAGAAAWLWIGLRCALNCFVSYGAITEADSAEYFEQGKRAILENVAIQQEDMRQEKPSKMYVQAIYDLIAAGKCKLHPVNEQSSPYVEILGYYDQQYVYLIPGAAFSAVCTFYRDQGSAFPIGRPVLHKRMAEEGIIATRPGEGYTPGKYVSCGQRAIRLLHVRRDVLAALGCDPVQVRSSDESIFPDDHEYQFAVPVRA